MALPGQCGRDPADWYVDWRKCWRDLQSLGAERLHLASVVDSLPPSSSWSRCSMAAVSVSAEDAQDPPSCVVKSPPATKSSAIPSRIHTMPAHTLYSRWPAARTQMPLSCPLCPSDSLFFFWPFRRHISTRRKPYVRSRNSPAPAHPCSPSVSRSLALE